MKLLCMHNICKFFLMPQLSTMPQLRCLYANLIFYHSVCLRCPLQWQPRAREVSLGLTWCEREVSPRLIGSCHEVSLGLTWCAHKVSAGHFSPNSNFPQTVLFSYCMSKIKPFVYIPLVQWFLFKAFILMHIEAKEWFFTSAVSTLPCEQRKHWVAEVWAL